MSKVMRSVKNVTKGYSHVQVKVREATSNDSWGPTGTQMSEIAQLTYNAGADFMDIMDMLDKRLNDKGKNWRHVLKALKVLDYCLHEGSERVVTWARQNMYIIKTLREFQYTDEEGRDVGQNVRVAAKELTALIIDDERLRAERTDRRSWKSRVTGLDENGPPSPYGSSDLPRPRPRPRRHGDDDDDAEYRLAIEASKAQEEEDRRNRASRQGEPDDEDLQKALQLSKEEEEARRKELEQGTSIFDGDLIDTNAPVQNQNQFTGYGNQGYQQGNPVDFFANPLDGNQMQGQPTGYMPNAYTGFQPQQTGYPGGYPNGYGMQQTGFGADPYGQQQQQAFQPQPTGYNPYMQQQHPQQHPQAQLQVPSPAPQETPVQPGSNNPWATNNQSQQQSLKPTPTGSNNPFATSFSRPQTSLSPQPSTLGSLPEQKTLSSFNSFNQQQQPPPPQPQQHQTPPPFTAPQKEITEHEAKLNTLLSGGEGQDTFGNTGQLRIPAQHTAPGTFVNSAGAGANRMAADATGSNPFLRSQFTGMPTVSYQQAPAATGPAGVNGNPFSGQKQGQGGGDLIQL